MTHNCCCRKSQNKHNRIYCTLVCMSGHVKYYISQNYHPVQQSCLNYVMGEARNWFKRFLDCLSLELKCIIRTNVYF